MSGIIALARSRPPRVWFAQRSGESLRFAGANLMLTHQSRESQYSQPIGVFNSPGIDCKTRFIHRLFASPRSSPAYSTPIGRGIVERLSGKAMARTGLRMMPTFPLPPLKFRTAGFPQYGFKAEISDEAFPAAWFAIVLRALCCQRYSLLCVKDDALMNTSARAGRPLYPRGPRSGPGYSVPVHQHLIGPIRPTRGHTPTSPSRGLYEVPSLCIFAYA